MKMYKQKKGNVLILFLSILFVFVVLSFLFIRMENKKSQFPKTLGEIQANMIETYQEAEKAMFFVDQAAKYSAEQASYDLGQKPELWSLEEQESGCGSYYGYALWNTDEQECFPDTKKAFLYLIDSYLNSYLSKQSLIPADNYEYIIKEEDGNAALYGFATGDIEIDIKKIKREKKDEDYIGRMMQTVSGVEPKGLFIWPLDGTKDKHPIINSCFGYRNAGRGASQNHMAIDIGSYPGDNIRAAADGTVEAVGGSFNQVVLRHDSLGYRTYYLHNSEVLVAKNDFVRQGDVIAKVGGYGKSGPNSYAPHLHFGVKKMVKNRFDVWIDPLTLYDNEYLKTRKFPGSSNCVYNAEVNNYPYIDIIKGNRNV